MTDEMDDRFADWARHPVTTKLRREMAKRESELFNQLLSRCRSSADADVRAALVDYQNAQAFRLTLGEGHA